MSQITIDLTNYRERRSAYVDPGKYRVQVEDAELTETKKKDPMVVLYLRIMGGEFDGQTIIDRMTLTERAMFRIVGFMQALGLPTPKKKFRVDISKFVGRTIDVMIREEDPYNGQPRSGVDQYLTIPKAQTQVSAVEDDEDDEDFEVVEEKPKKTRKVKSAPVETDDDDESDLDDDLMEDLDDL